MLANNNCIPWIQVNDIVTIRFVNFMELNKSTRTVFQNTLVTLTLAFVDEPGTLVMNTTFVIDNDLG